MVVVEYNRTVVVVVKYNRIVVVVVVVVVEYNRIVVVAVEYLESVIFLHRSHPLQILFSQFFSVQTILLHVKHFVVVGAFCCQ